MLITFKISNAIQISVFVCSHNPYNMMCCFPILFSAQEASCSTGDACASILIIHTHLIMILTLEKREISDYTIKHLALVTKAPCNPATTFIFSLCELRQAYSHKSTKHLKNLHVISGVNVALLQQILCYKLKYMKNHILFMQTYTLSSNDDL